MANAQISERCPDHKLVCTAELKAYQLSFPRFSKNRQCGVASIVDAAEESVWGVVFELSEKDKESLNSSEGYRPNHESSKNSYNVTDIQVVLHNGSSFKCFTYVAVPQPGKFLPSAEYLALLINGAEEHNLPRQYIDKLKNIPTGL